MEQALKAISENVYARGKHGILYVRRRIPAALRAAYPAHQEHIVRSLGTADRRSAKELARAENTRIDAEFRQKRQELDLSQASLTPKSIAQLDDEQLQAVAKFWLRQVLMTDEQQRQAGLDDDEFDELGQKLIEQRAELGRMLAQGKSLNIFPALHGFLYLCGLDFNPDVEEAKRASYAFLRTVIETLEHQLRRQRGDIVDTDNVAPPVQHPLTVIAPERAPVDASRPTWDMVFEAWRDYVENRPKPTTIASQTPWRDLRNFAAARGVQMPGDVTPELMTAFVEDMRPRLEVSTLNERLTKIRGIYKVAVGKHVLKSNPAAGTLGVKESGAKKRKKRRLPFEVADLQTIFGSEIFTQHKRSRGQSGEASYWIPLLMYYTGARPEELAGLALSDLVHDSQFGWSLSLVDRLCEDDVDLFDDVPETHRRTLKNAGSVRSIPVAPELIELGLLRYVKWLREREATVFFPTLKKDFHGKLSGSFSKFFGRYKRALGITDKRKVLYSFRHTMKDTLEAAGMPSKLLQRMLGHATGDGRVTDGYGSDRPLFEQLVGHFSKVRFAAIPARSWEPGRGSVGLKDDD